jgi:hypothetical protein
MMVQYKMTSIIQAQLHLWPWSIGIDEETVDLKTGPACFSYYGSPVISVPKQASLFMTNRYEMFVPLGQSFKTILGEFLLYETPHGVISSEQFKSVSTRRRIRIHTKSSRDIVEISPQGAMEHTVGHGDAQKESNLARVIIGWSNFFDRLLEECQKDGFENELAWPAVLDQILRMVEDINQPRMALIVTLAEKMQCRLPIIVNTARRILLHERRMLASERLTETDSACLQWISRQAGETIIQKAAANRQKLLGIARRESFDTLENRVLKDFLFRCNREGRRYLKSEVGESINLQQSKRAIIVRKYRQLCHELHQVPHLEHISAPPVGFKPNYVLQNDSRYKEIWHEYVRLLRREDEEDCLWDWQARTWADLARLLVNCAISELAQKNGYKSKAKLYLEKLLSSTVHLLKEQRLGTRINAGSEPGPFFINRSCVARRNGSVLEIVHPEHASEHPATKLLGRLGGQLYLVFTPLARRKRTVIVVWAVHTASAKSIPSWEEISYSAGRGLRSQIQVLMDYRDADFPTLRGFVIASDIEAKSSDIFIGKNDGLHLVQVPTDQRDWHNALAGISTVIEDLVESII